MSFFRVPKSEPEVKDEPEEIDFSKSQEAIPLPVVIGRQTVQVNIISRIYNLKPVEVKGRPGKK